MTLRKTISKGKTIGMFWDLQKTIEFITTGKWKKPNKQNIPCNNVNEKCGRHFYSFLFKNLNSF